jgi:hypothetical protein
MSLFAKFETVIRGRCPRWTAGLPLLWVLQVMFMKRHSRLTFRRYKNLLAFDDTREEITTTFVPSKVIVLVSMPINKDLHCSASATDSLYGNQKELREAGEQKGCDDRAE